MANLFGNILDNTQIVCSIPNLSFYPDKMLRRVDYFRNWLNTHLLGEFCHCGFWVNIQLGFKCIDIAFLQGFLQFEFTWPWNENEEKKTEQVFLLLTCWYFFTRKVAWRFMQCCDKGCLFASNCTSNLFLSWLPAFLITT